MSYNKTSWMNDQYDTPPDTYTIEDLGNGQFRIRRAGNRTQVGTPLSADNLNKLETQYDAAKADLDAHTTAATLGHPDGSVTDAKIGSRTADQSQAPSGSTGTLTQLLSWLANRIKAITGAANWYDAPATTLAAASTHAASTAAGTHGSAAGATANTLAHRDSNGDLTARVLRSTVAAGTAPLSVASNTVVPSLNADMVDGVHGASLAAVIGGGRTKIQSGTNNSDVAFTFPSAFSAAPVIVGIINGSSSGYYVVASNVTATGATFKINTGAAQPVFWIAIGS